MTKVIEAKTREDIEHLVANNDKVIVDFAAESWCIPCQKLKPHFDMAAEKDDSTVYVHADIDLNPQLQADYGIMGVPTLHAYKDGKYVEEVPNKIRTAVTLTKYAQSL